VPIVSAYFRSLFYYRERKCAENYFKKWHNSFFLKLQSSLLVISKHNSFQVLFDKIASVYFIRKIYLYFTSIGNWPAQGTSTVPVVSAHCRSVFDYVTVRGSVAEWLACWTQAQEGLGLSRSRDAVG